MAARAGGDTNGYPALKERLAAVQDQQRRNVEAIDNIEKKRTAAGAELHARIDATQKDIGQRIDGLQGELAKRGQTNWLVVLSACALMITLTSATIGLITNPISTKLTDGEQRDRDFRREVKTDYVLRAQYNSDLVHLQGAVSAASDAMTRLRADYATREQLTAVAGRVDGNAKIIGSLYPVDRVFQDQNAALRAMQQQLNDIQGRLTAVAATPVVVPPAATRSPDQR